MLFQAGDHWFLHPCNIGLFVWRNPAESVCIKGDWMATTSATESTLPLQRVQIRVQDRFLELWATVLLLPKQASYEYSFLVDGKDSVQNQKGHSYISSEHCHQLSTNNHILPPPNFKNLIQNNYVQALFQSLTNAQHLVQTKWFMHPIFAQSTSIIFEFLSFEQYQLDSITESLPTFPQGKTSATSVQQIFPYAITNHGENAAQNVKTFESHRAFILSHLVARELLFRGLHQFSEICYIQALEVAKYIPNKSFPEDAIAAAYIEYNLLAKSTKQNKRINITRCVPENKGSIFLSIHRCKIHIPKYLDMAKHLVTTTAQLENQLLKGFSPEFSEAAKICDSVDVYNTPEKYSDKASAVRSPHSDIFSGEKRAQSTNRSNITGSCFKPSPSGLSFDLFSKAWNCKSSIRNNAEIQKQESFLPSSGMCDYDQQMTSTDPSPFTISHSGISSVEENRHDDENFNPNLNSCRNDKQTLQNICGDSRLNNVVSSRQKLKPKSRFERGTGIFRKPHVKQTDPEEPEQKNSENIVPRPEISRSRDFMASNFRKKFAALKKSIRGHRESSQNSSSVSIPSRSDKMHEKKTKTVNDIIKKENVDFDDVELISNNVGQGEKSGLDMLINEKRKRFEVAKERDLDLGSEELNESVQIASAILLGFARSFLKSGELALAEKRVNEAITVLENDTFGEEIIYCLDGIESTLLLADAHVLHGDILCKMGKEQEALRCRENAEAIHKRVRRATQRKKFSELELDLPIEIQQRLVQVLSESKDD